MLATVLGFLAAAVAWAIWISVARLAWSFHRLAKVADEKNQPQAKLLALNALIMCLLMLFFLAKIAFDIAWKFDPPQPQLEKRRAR